MSSPIAGKTWLEKGISEKTMKSAPWSEDSPSVAYVNRKVENSK